jgi:trimethylamine corrinoid protein
LVEEEFFGRLKRAILEYDEEAAKKAAFDAITAGVDPIKAIKEGLAKGMSEIGEKFRKYEIFLPHVMLAASAMKKAMEILMEKVTPDRVSEVKIGTVVIGTVKGDIHDIGKNLVASMLSVAGFEINDLGFDVSSMDFIDKAKDVDADIIGMSTLMTTTQCYQRDVIIYLKDMNLREQYFVIVGGGAVTPDWAEEITADGYGKYADDGVNLCLNLINGKVPPPLKEPMIKE